jgi:hypothetical protein
LNGHHELFAMRPEIRGGKKPVRVADKMKIAPDPPLIVAENLLDYRSISRQYEQVS